MGFRANFLIVAISIFLINISNISALFAEPYKPQKPMPISEMAKDFDTASVKISPDGKFLAAIVKIPEFENPVVRVWETEDMTKEPRQFGFSKMRVYNVVFLKEGRILLFGTAQFSPNSSFLHNHWRTRLVICDLDGKNQTYLSSGYGESFSDNEQLLTAKVHNPLDNDKYNILLKLETASGYYLLKVNIKNGKTDHLWRVGDNEASDLADFDGELRIKSRYHFHNGLLHRKLFLKDSSGKWNELEGLKQIIDRRDFLNTVRVTNDGKFIFILTDENSDKATLKKFNIETQEFSDTLIRHDEYEIVSVTFGSSEDEYALHSDKIREICFGGPAIECQSLDVIDARINDQIIASFPNSNVYQTVKEGGKRVSFSIDAPNLPTTYFFLKNENELVRVGSVREGWDQTNLGEGQWIEYKARDGLVIPGVLTLPPGYEKAKHGSIPLVVMPHGGPWARDELSFDESFWPQMFATRGFAVLQPNFRGSYGLGNALWKAGDKEWGAKMQDDLDDGAKWLVEQGIANSNKMMIYGYSYGGFAAAAAAARSGGASKGLWQCAISGAPIIDLERAKEETGATTSRGKRSSASIAGWNPIEHLSMVEIPWLIFHGDYDHISSIMHSEDTVSKMKKLKPDSDFRFVKIFGMSHTLIGMTPQHKEQLMGEILSWTANNCGNISADFDDAEADKIVAKYSKPN